MTPDLLDSAFRGAAAALLALNMILLLRGARFSQRQAAVAAFTLSVIAYLACSVPGRPWQGHPAFVAVIVLCVAAPALFWLTARAIFDDAFRLRAADAALLAIPPAISFSGAGALATLAASALFVTAGLWVALRHWRADLVEARRQFRAWLAPIVAVYLLVVLGVEMRIEFEPQWPGLATLNAAGIALLALGTAVGLASDGVQAFFPETAAPVGRIRAVETASERRLRERLLELVERQHAYRETGLTVVALAARLATSEHTLRRLINQRLGFRNFNDFLSRYRIEEACSRLEREDTPILNIALEVGYGSIGPFNRAFKQLRGVTPSQYRAARLSAPQG